MKRSSFTRWLACLLSLAMIITSLPETVFATGSVVETKTMADLTPDPVTETVSSSEEPHIISELTEKRDEITKYFAMSDGTIKACIYPQNVHYLENGKYEEIDNTLVESTEEGKTYYENQKNSFSVKIPESFTDDYIEFSDENGYVKFKLIGASNKKIEKITKKKKSDETDLTIAKNVNDRAVFKAVKGDIDIEYDLVGNKLKETIVLYKKTKNSFVFDIQTSAAKAVINNDNSISFYDSEGVEIYQMASPYMTDSVGEYSNAVETQLIASTNGYTLTYTPDYEWLSAKERVYPVKIDPTLVQAIYKETVADTYVTSLQTSSDNDIRGGWDVLNIGRRAQVVDGSQIVLRGLIRFEIPSEIGSNDCIVDAKLDLVHYTDASTVSVNGTQIDVHELTSSFSEGNTWWGNQPSYDPMITDYVLVDTTNTFTESTFSYDSYNITCLVSKWHNGSDNYGILLKLHDDTTNVSTNQQVFYFAKQSIYYGSISKFVEITYRNTTGLEDYWSYTTQDFGQYGIGYVNNYNGNQTYVHDDTSFNSIINGFTLSHVYNSSTSAQTHSVNDKMGYYGAGWNLNLFQKFEEVTVSGNSSVKFKYTDGDGTEHYFVETSDGEIVDEDGLGYTYQDISEGHLENQITDKNGTILKFDRFKYLRRIIDANGNTINLEYGTIPNVDNFLGTITTSSGGSFTLSYDSNYNLTGITDNAQRTTTYHYDSGNLTEIHYPDNTVLKFEYDTENRLQGITAPDGTRLRYEYDSKNGKISAVRFYGTDGSASSNTSFEYSQNQTRVVDSYNRGITYQFDTVGRPTCVYDDEQNIYSQTYNPTVTNGSGIFNNNKLATSSNGAVYVNNLLTNPVFADDLKGWTTYKQNQDALISVDSGVGLLTAKSAKITSNGNTVEVIQQAVSTIPEGTYTFSGYIKTENVQTQTHGAALEIVVYGKNGTRMAYSDFITGTTDTEIDNGFQHLSVSITLEEGEYIDRVTAGLYNASGTVYIDSLQLEEGNTANQINMIDNSSFENSSGLNTLPMGYFTYFSDSTSGTVTNEKIDGNYSYKINGYVPEQRYIVKQMFLDGEAGDIYSFGGWAKANSIPHKETGTEFKMLFHFAYDDGTSDWFDFYYNDFVDEWQFIMNTVIAKQDYYAIEVICSYNKTANTAYFDNIFLYRDTMQSYTYDENGNVTSTTDYASQNETFQYNGDNNLAKLIAPTGSSYEYLYDSNHNLTFARSGEGVAYDLGYDSQGNAVSTSMGSHFYAASIQAGKTYYIRLKSNGKYLTVYNAETANCANVVQAQFSGGSHQKWKVESTSDGYYILVPQHADSMALDISDAANAEDTNVQIFEKNHTGAQKFKIIPQNDYTYTVTPECSTDGKILTVCFAGSNDNVTLISPQGSNNADQEWYFEEVEQLPAIEIEDGAIYQFRARNSGKYIDVSGHSTAEGTPVTQYEQTFGYNQRFIVRRYEDTAYYTLSPLHAPEMLLEMSTDVYEYPLFDCFYLQLGNGTITDRSLFLLEYHAEYQGFFIIPKANETYALDVANYSTSNGADLIFTGKGADVNRFFLAEKFSDTITSSATYQDNGNYLDTLTDARGNTTSYTYDTSRGLQTAVTDAKGNTTEYAYNALNDRLESVSVADSTVSYQYKTNGALKKITTPSGTVYDFSYDVFGRMNDISMGSHFLCATFYKDNYTALVSQISYGNGEYKAYTYDEQDRLISEIINDNKCRTYLYDKRGNIAQINDLLSDVTTTFNYDLIGRVSGIKSSDGQKMNFIYDSFNRLSLSKWSLGNLTLSSGYIYGDNAVDGQKTGLIYGVNLNSTQQLAYQYDELSRLVNRTVGTDTPFMTEYTYLEGKDYGTTTTLVKTVKNGDDILEYTYDELGNITSVAKDGTVVEQYSYDALNQLISATYGGDTYVYSYDNGGNITEVKKNDVVIKSYSYGDSQWKDLLTVFNGETITYDDIGNPQDYRESMSLSWENGRQLEAIFQNNNTVASYAYDTSGLRTAKTVNGITTDFYWLNGTLQGQQTGGEYLLFLYDENSSAYGFIVKNETTELYYYYEFNLQGDIIGIIDSEGTKVVEYTYDAWGNILSVTGTMADSIGQKNPLRYRGYYYDEETGFYYVSSRYYDPEIGRWINLDSQLNTSLGVLGLNLFAYCLNNPANKVDYSGNKPGDLFDTMDEAARDAAIYLGALSFENGWEYATAIYTVNTTVTTYENITKSYRFLWWKWTRTFKKTIRTTKTQYTYKAVKTNEDPMGVVVPNAPLFKKRVATLHTHPMGSMAGITRFSEADKNNAKKRGVPNYVHGPNGELRKYDPATGEDILIFSDLPVSPKTPWLD